MSDKLNLLLIEDNPGDVRIIEEMVLDLPEMKLFNVNCISFAFEYLDKNKTDLVLLDLGLPDSQGLDTVRRVVLQIPSIPVVVFTGHKDDELALASIKIGAQDYLIKGKIDTDMFARSIHYSIERKSLEIALRKSQANLTILNEQLEQRVIDRTAQLQAINKELETFSYTVSHDLRAPLRAIDGFTSILLENYKSKFDDEGKRLCAVIGDSAKHMGQLIDDLLDFSRLSRIELNIYSIDMEQLAGSVYSELTTPETRHRISFQLGNLNPVSGDRMLIRQVWVNLISNAIKFSSRREHAVIKISSKPEENRVVYSIMDYGAGFDMKYINKLFGVFQRLHSVKEFEGTGVGLAIVQHIIIRHGGEVWAEGEVDKGATFYFSLPI
ncbi:MAG: ATP-binding protein [Bacteroidetes bacterium]|nr:ATP-binding protein [Bacteroidota bacterium]